MAGQAWENFGPNDKVTPAPAWEDFGPDQPTSKAAWEDFGPEPAAPKKAPVDQNKAITLTGAIEQDATDPISQGRAAIHDSVLADEDAFNQRLRKLAIGSKLPADKIVDSLGDVSFGDAALTTPFKVKNRSDLIDAIEYYRKGGKAISFVNRPNQQKTLDNGQELSAPAPLTPTEVAARAFGEAIDRHSPGLSQTLGRAIVGIDPNETNDVRGAQEQFWKDQANRTENPLLDTIARGGGSVAGYAVTDPTNLLAPGEGAAARMFSQGLIGTGADLATQALENANGERNGVDLEQTAMNAGAGALLEGLIGRDRIHTQHPIEEPRGPLNGNGENTAGRLADIIRSKEGTSDVTGTVPGGVSIADRQVGNEKIKSVLVTNDRGEDTAVGVIRDGRITLTDPRTGEMLQPDHPDFQAVQNQLTPPKAPTKKQLAAQAKQKIVDDTTAQINKITDGWSNSPEFNVVASFADLPLAVKAMMKKEKAERAMGLVDEDGTVHIISNNIKDKAELPAVVFHETLGHIGLKNVFREDLDNMLTALYNGNNKIQKLAEEYAAKNPVYANRPDALARNTEEVLANLSANGRVPPSIKNRIVYAFRQWAREKGLTFAQNYTWSEVQHILSMAHNTVINGEKNSSVFDGVRYMMTGTQGAINRNPKHETPKGLVKAWDMLDDGHEGDWGSLMHQATGWFVGPDGRMRQEISDHEATLSPDAIERINNGESVPMGELLDHPELYARYPQFKEMPISNTQGWNYSGVYLPGAKRIEVRTTNREVKEIRDTLLHEVQHAIQDYEGFASGSNMEASVHQLPAKKIYDIAPKAMEYYEKLAEQAEQRRDLVKKIDDLPITQEYRRIRDERDALLGDRNFHEMSGDEMSQYNSLNKQLDEIDATVMRGLGFNTDNIYHLPMEDFDFVSGVRAAMRDSEAKIEEDARLYQLASDSRKSAEALDQANKEGNLAALRKELTSFPMLADDAYRHSFGEVEARDTAYRADMTDWQREVREPYKKEADINPDDYVFDLGGDGRSEQSGGKYMMPSEDRKAGNLNLDKIKTTDDVENFLKDVASKIPKGEVQSHDATEELARAMGMNAKKVLRIVEDLSPEKMTAARIFLEKSANRLTRMAKTIEEGNASEKQQLDFARSLAIHSQVQAKIARLTSNAGRILNSFKIEVEGVEALKQALKDASDLDLGDPKNVKYLAALVNKAQGDPGKIAKLARDATGPLPEDYITSLRYAMMLFGPGTHVKNFLGNLTMSGLDIVEHGGAAVLGNVRRAGRAVMGLGPSKADRVLAREVAARNYGFIKAFLDGQTYKDTAASWKSGVPVHKVSKVEAGEAVLPLPFSAPTKALAASDSFWRSMIQNGDLYGRAVRQAYHEGKRGSDLYQRIDELMTDPTYNMIEESNKHSSILQFVDDTSAVGSWLEMGKARKAKMNAGQRALRFTLQLAVPFTRVTDRMFWSAIRRSPLGVFDKVNLADIKAGGAQRDLALSRMIIGSAAMGWMAQEALEGRLTGSGPTDPRELAALKATGWQPNSLRVGDKYYSLAGIDAVSISANTIANLVESFKKGDMSEATFGQKMGHALASIGRSMNQNSFTDQLGQLFQLAETGPMAEGRFNNYVAGLAGSMVPSGLRAANQQFFDNAQRDTSSDGSLGGAVTDRVKSAIPGLSTDLPQKYDVYGRPMTYDSRNISGVAESKKVDKDPVVQEVYRLNQLTGKVLVGPVRRSPAIGITTSAHVQAYQKLSGEYIYNDLKDEINSPDWKNMSDEDKIETIKEIVKDQRENAREELGFVKDDEE